MQNSFPSKIGGASPYVVEFRSKTLKKR